MSEDLFKIKPIKVPQIESDLPDRIPGKYHFTCLIGIRKSGKTCVLVNLINNFYAKSYDMILVLSPSVNLDPTWKSVKKHKNVVTFDKCTKSILEAILQVQEERSTHGKDLLLILDDFSTVKSLTSVIDLISARGRHLKLSCITSSQYYRHISICARNNMDSALLWRLSRKEQIKISEDIPQITEEEFVSFATEATSVPYQFVYIDFRKPANEMLRVGF